MMSDAGNRALRRAHIGAGIAGGSLASWILSEIVATAPLTFYFVFVCFAVFIVVGLVDTWRLR